MIIKSHEIPKIVKGHWSTTGLVGYWPMMPYEVFGSKVFDLSGNRNDGTFGAGATSPIWKAGKFGSAVFFSGSGDGDHIVLPASNSIIADAPVTIVAWVMNDGGVPTNNRVISLHRGATAGSGLTISIATNWVSYSHDGSVGSTLDSGVVADTSWHQLVITNDDTIHKIYVDGIFKASQARGVALGSYPAYIGHYEGVSSAYAWEGLIDHILIYNRVLSAGKIAKLYRNPFLPIEREPIELWVGATSVGVAPSANPKGPLGHPLCGALAGPISF